MSLLDDVSIVVTPNGYKAGELYAVVPVPVEGAELVDNGDFATDTDWIKLNGSTISGGVGNIIANGAVSSTGSNWSLYQTNVFSPSTRYRIQFRARQTSGSGNFNVAYAYGLILNEVITSSFVDYSIDFTTSSDSWVNELTFGGFTIGDTFEVDNVSVKEYTSADMDVTRETAATRVDENGLVNYAEVVSDTELVTNGDFATDSDWTKNGWTINGEASNDGVNTGNLNQDIGLQQDKTYLVEVTITNYNSGTLQVRLGLGSTIDVGSSEDTFSLTLTSTSTNSLLRFYPKVGSLFNGSISNISVKEVTRDNVPRIDYTGGGCPHILAEPQRTNLITYSEDLSTYSTVSTTVSTTTETSPIESVTPFLITETATSNQHYIGGNSVSLSGNNTIYCFVKNVSSGRYFKMWGLGLGGANEAVIFDTNTETIYEPSTSTLYVSGSAKLEDYSNGWFRCSITVNTTITSFVAIGLINTVSGFGNDMYLGDITKSVLITGVQLEVGSYPTSLIPTNGEAGGVTRNQDIFTRDGIGSLINSTEGVLFVEAATFENGADCRITLSDGTITNRVSIEWDILANTIKGFVGSNGNLVSPATYNQTDYNKIAIKYKENDCALWINGTEVDTDFAVSVLSGVNQLEFSNYGGSLTFEGKVKQLQVYDTALTDEQLLQLTGESGTDFYESYAEMASALTYTIQ